MLADPFDLMEAEEWYQYYMDDIMAKKTKAQPVADTPLAVLVEQVAETTSANEADLVTYTPENGSENHWDDLLASFDAMEVQIRLLMRSKNRKRGRVVPYIEGNSIRNRLDCIAGRKSWCATYEAIPAEVPTVLCRLTILGETKENIGIGDDHKAACTDSLKRAAMEHGIGRYLAYCPEVWVDLNENGYLSEKRRTRALILHLLGYTKAEIEQAMDEEDRAEQEVRYVLYQFKAGTNRKAAQTTPLRPALAS